MIHYVVPLATKGRVCASFQHILLIYPSAIASSPGAFSTQSRRSLYCQGSSACNFWSSSSGKVNVKCKDIARPPIKRQRVSGLSRYPVKCHLMPQSLLATPYQSSSSCAQQRRNLNNTHKHTTPRSNNHDIIIALRLRDPPPQYLHHLMDLGILLNGEPVSPLHN